MSNTKSTKHTKKIQYTKGLPSLPELSSLQQLKKQIKSIKCEHICWTTLLPLTLLSLPPASFLFFLTPCPISLLLLVCNKEEEEEKNNKTLLHFLPALFLYSLEWITSIWWHSDAANVSSNLIRSVAQSGSQNFSCVCTPALPRHPRARATPASPTWTHVRPSVRLSIRSSKQLWLCVCCQGFGCHFGVFQGF